MRSFLVNYKRYIRKFFSVSPDKYLCVFIGSENYLFSNRILYNLSDNIVQINGAKGEAMEFVYSFRPDRKEGPIYEIELTEQSLFDIEEEEFQANFGLNCSLSKEISAYYHIPQSQLPAFLIYKNAESSPEVVSINNEELLNQFLDKFFVLRSFLLENQSSLNLLLAIEAKMIQDPSLISENIKGIFLLEDKIKKKQELCLKDYAGIMAFKFHLSLEEIEAHLRRISKIGQLDKKLLDYIIAESIKTNELGMEKKETTEVSQPNEKIDDAQLNRVNNTQAVDHVESSVTHEQNISPLENNNSSESIISKTSKKYDIFLSCKSADYPLGSKVYDVLMDKGFKVFFANSELRGIGRSDYGSEIDRVLNESQHLIIVASKKEYLYQDTSPYVYYEWHSFSEEIKTGRKTGNIITLLTNDVKIEDLPYALRHCQSFSFDEFDKVIDYLRTS